MFLIKQTDLALENIIHINQPTKCSHSATTMKQEESHNFTHTENGSISTQTSKSSNECISSENTNCVASRVSSSFESPSSPNQNIIIPMSPHDATINLKKTEKNGSKQDNTYLTSRANNNNTPAITGDRLQFFKDGKFILELARAREGDKIGWVSVPRKAYWPPRVLSSISGNFKNNISNASFSCSDDNSSAQSSPYSQRDHHWKKNIPKKHVSKEMIMFYYRPIKVIKFSNEVMKSAKRKHRRPYDESKVSVTIIKNEKELKTQKETSNTNKCFINDIQKLNVVINKEKTGRKLDIIIQKLKSRINSGLLRLNHINVSHHQHISPRKRILREFEKVSLEDTQKLYKRSRCKTGASSSLNGQSLVCSTKYSSALPQSLQLTTSMSKCNQIDMKTKTQPVNSLSSSSTTTTKQANTEHSNTSKCQLASQYRISSYSITSLLGHESSSSSTKKKQQTNVTSFDEQITSKDDTLGSNTQDILEQTFKYGNSTSVPIQKGNATLSADNKIKSSYLSETSHYQHTSVSPSHRYSPLLGLQNRRPPLVLNKSKVHSPTRNINTSRQHSSSLSPIVESGIRALPKKGICYQQQFQQDDAFNTDSSNGKVELTIRKEENIEHNLNNMYHPVSSPFVQSNTSSSMYPYMFTPQTSFLNTSFSSYYQYAAATMYRNPLWMHYPASLVGQSPVPILEQFNVSHNPTWVPMEQTLATNKSNNTGEESEAFKTKDEQSSDVPLNLSRH
ncbi:protein hairless [Culicoides brevitarsis]|uniref:protein hairless n=1 Tax=Culicoides brevitarsis TaxID=469753 RepID=UPI00307BC0C9